VVVSDPVHFEALAPYYRRSRALILEPSSLNDASVLAPGDRIPRRGHPPGTALICFTSGTEGAPKGVMLSAATIRFLVDSNLRLSKWTTADRILCALPLVHMSGLITWVTAQCAGATIVISPDIMWPAQVLDAFLRQRVTVAPLVPYYFGRLVKH